MLRVDCADMSFAKALRSSSIVVLGSLLVGAGIVLVIVVLRGWIPTWESSILSVAYVLFVAYLARRIVTRSTQSGSPLLSTAHNKWSDLLKSALYFLAAMLWAVTAGAFANDGIVAGIIIILPIVTLLVIAGFYFGRSIYNRIRP